jgi:predicted enzyme related to lactoylglutathione lyase
MLATVNVPTNDISKAEKFYQYLVGTQPLINKMSQKDSRYLEIRNDNVILTINPRNHPQETTACYFKVDDLDTAIKNLLQLGGKVITQPFQLATNLKRPIRAAIVADPDGNGVGIVEDK